MSEPFLGLIGIFGFDFPPRGWALCDGQILPINQNQSLFSLLGTTYGGDGRTTFALPDLRGRAPIHEGDGHALGSNGGEDTHTLVPTEMPEHTHALQASADNAGANTAGGNVWAKSAQQFYHDLSTSASTDMNAGTVKSTGGQAHDNMQPFLVVSFAIALQGLFPSRN